MGRGAIEFFKWCNTPIYRPSGELGFRLRVVPQFPEYNKFIIIDENGNSIFKESKFLTAEEVYNYWSKELENKS